MTHPTARSSRTAAIARWALWLALSFTGLAMGQAEVTLDQVYEAAQAGRVEQALQMMQPVLKAHPGSAKAHYVQAELLARQGLAGQAREQLALAEKLAPGLPFAKPESVQHLRGALASPSGGKALDKPARASFDAPAAPASGSSMPWGVLLAVGGGALAAWMLTRLGRPTASPASAGAAAATAPGYPAASAASAGPAESGAGWAVPGMNTSMPANMGVPAPAAPGLGRQVAGGLATGLAVGAGVMAAESLGRSLFGGTAHAATAQEPGSMSRYDPEFGNAAVNADMGGNDFGIVDASSWDDAGSGGSSSDWDV